VARAKRTDRAEARRKYRAYLLAQEEAEASESEGQADPGRSATSRPVRDRLHDVRPESLPPARTGIMAGARMAYHQPTYLSDLRYFSTLVLRTNAIWPIAVLCVFAGGYSIVRLNYYATDPILPIIFSFVFFPPLVPAMLAGFLAPRATWLAGLVASFLCTVTMMLVLFTGGVTLTQETGTANATPSITPSAATANVASASATAAQASLTPAPTPTASASPAASTAAASPSASSSPSGSTTTTTGTYTVSGLLAAIFALLLQSLPIGAGIGALSGWYKRFLALTSGPRQARPSRSGSSRSAQRRRPAARK
jgi:hypothetical protein